MGSVDLFEPVGIIKLVAVIFGDQLINFKFFVIQILRFNACRYDSMVSRDFSVIKSFGSNGWIGGDGCRQAVVLQHDQDALGIIFLR